MMWGTSQPRDIPAHPYRDSALVYGFFAALVVLIAWATGGPVLKALVLAALFFVATVTWTWFRYYQRIRRQAHQDELL